MTTCSIRLVAYLVLLLALGTGVSLAASGPTKVAAANPAPVAFCPTGPSLAQRRTIHTSTHNRITFHCRCCGRDENGHCTINVAIYSVETWIRVGAFCLAHCPPEPLPV
jgi:hypothetical protein